MLNKTIDVVVGVIVNADQQVLVAKRQKKQHLAGCWEFSGGKIDAGESANDALERELREELGISVSEAEFLFPIEFDYPEKRVCLHIFRVDSFTGKPEGREGQEIAWRTHAELAQLTLPPANTPILEYLKESLLA